jgi:hypothetical protein
MQAVCDILEQLVSEGVLSSYAIGGATAAGFHGEPLATRDIDVFVFLDPPKGSLLVTLEPLFNRLQQLGFTEFDEEGILIHGFPVQFLSASPGLETEAVADAAHLEWDGHHIRVMTPEYLAAIALCVGRPKDRARLVYLTSLTTFNRDKMIEILHRYRLWETWSSWSVALGIE